MTNDPGYPRPPSQLDTPGCGVTILAGIGGFLLAFAVSGTVAVVLGGVALLGAAVLLLHPRPKVRTTGAAVLGGAAVALLLGSACVQGLEGI